MKERQKCILSHYLNVSRDSEEVMSDDKSFHIHAPVTGKVRHTTVDTDYLW